MAISTKADKDAIKLSAAERGTPAQILKLYKRLRPSGLPLALVCAMPSPTTGTSVSAMDCLPPLGLIWS